MAENNNTNMAKNNDSFQGNSYEDYLNYFTEQSKDPEIWYHDKPASIKVMASKVWEQREKQLKKQQKEENKRRAAEKKNFDTWSESLDMSNYYYDDNTGNIIDTATNKPITDDQRKRFTDNNRIARNNLNDVNNYANSGIYRIGSQDGVLPGIGRVAKEGISALLGSDGKANPDDLAAYLNKLVKNGQITLPPGKKEYSKKDAEALLTDGIAQYNGYFIPSSEYLSLQSTNKDKQAANATGNSVFALGRKDADNYFSGNQTAVEKVQELSEKGYSESDIKNYFTGLYEGKGGLSPNAEAALASYNKKKSQPAINSTDSQKMENKKDVSKTENIDDMVSVTGGKSNLGKGIDSVYNDTVNDTEKDDIEKKIARYNKGFKSSVGDSWKDELKDAFGAKLDLLRSRPITTIADYLGTALMNASGVIKGGDTSHKSMLQQVDQETLKGALERYNEKRNKMIETDASLLGKEYANDQEFLWQLKQLYANKELQRKIQDLDISNRKALLQAYKEVADSGFFGDNAEEIITNILKIGATQGAMEGGLPQAISQIAGAAGTAIGSAASGLSSAVGTLFNFVK